MPQINFGPNADKSAVSAKTLAILEEIMTEAGVASLIITSTARNPFNQARVMYDNLERHGVDNQLALYGPRGDEVIEVYRDAKAQGKDRNAIISLMEKKIIDLGPVNVSRHCADPKTVNVCDIAPSSIPGTLHAAFEDAIRGHGGIDHHIFPSQKDPAFHIEVAQV